jgi:hypothetical protein
MKDSCPKCGQHCETDGEFRICEFCNIKFRPKAHAQSAPDEPDPDVQDKLLEHAKAWLDEETEDQAAQESERESAMSNQSEIPKDAPNPAKSALSRTHVFVIIGLLAALLVAQLFGLTSTKASTTQWDYVISPVHDGLFDVTMKRLGDNGWELIFARRATSNGTPIYEMIFKRPKL